MQPVSRIKSGIFLNNERFLFKLMCSYKNAAIKLTDFNPYRQSQVNLFFLRTADFLCVITLNITCILFFLFFMGSKIICV